MSSNHQRQVWQHDFEIASQLQLTEAFLSNHWRAQKLEHDYGEDLIGLPFKNRNPTGQGFYIQLKGTDNINQYLINDGKKLSYSIELANLQQWNTYPIPVVLIVWDICSRIGYWCHAQAFIVHQIKHNSNWLKNTNNAKEPTRKVYINLDNFIKAGDLKSLESFIESEWSKVQFATSHFDILYKASKVSLKGSELESYISPSIQNQLSISQASAKATIEPRAIDNWLNLAALHYETSNLKASLHSINKACEIDDTSPLTQQLKACILAEYAIENGNIRSLLHEALEIFSALEQKQDYHSHYNIGNCYSALEQHHDAIKHYGISLTKEKESLQKAKILNNLGRSLVKVGNEKEGEAAFREALELDASLWNLYSSIAHLEASKGNHEEACEKFEFVLRLNPSFKEEGDSHLLCYARSLFQLKRYREAYTQVEKVIFASPINQSAIQLKSHLLAILRREDNSFEDKARSYFESRLLDNSSDLLARSELNLIYKDAGMTSQREKLLQETIVMEGAPVMAFYDYAELLVSQGKSNEADFYLAKAIDIEPNHFILHSAGRLYKEMELYDKAIETLEKTISDSCNPVHILSEISDCFYLKGDLEGDLVTITMAILEGAQSEHWQNNLFFALNEQDIEATNYFDSISDLWTLEQSIDRGVIENRIASLKQSVNTALIHLLEYSSKLE